MFYMRLIGEDISQKQKRQIYLYGKNLTVTAASMDMSKLQRAPRPRHQCSQKHFARRQKITCRGAHGLSLINFLGIPRITKNPTALAMRSCQGQDIPTSHQNGYRHMVIEHRILKLMGSTFRNNVIQYKKQGLKTNMLLLSC